MSKYSSLNKWALRTAAILISPLLASVGLFLGFFVIQLATSGMFSTWQSIGSPPARPESIVAAGFDWVFVESETGMLFEFEAENSFWQISKPEGSWHRAEKVRVWESRCQFEAPRGPTRPAQAVDYVQFGYCPEVMLDVRYALMSDGTVMRWSTGAQWHSTSASPSIGFSIGGIVGIVLGVNLFTKSRTPPDNLSVGAG